MKHYNYIFAGTGLAALMTIYEMILSKKFEDKTILLLDINLKKDNDRTWCFWENKSSKFDEIVFKNWKKALFADSNFERNLNLNPYVYQMIRGIDFYNLVFDLISKQQNITFLNQKVTDFNDLETNCIVKTESEQYNCDKIFNSIYNPKIVKQQNRYPLLSQHFIGWFIKSKQEVFDKEMVTFMDFSVSQKNNTRFMYVLPTSNTEALIEYTLFSEHLLDKKEYEVEIELYIKKLGIIEYEIVEKEQGNIPMTSYKFWKNNSKSIINIGSAGGWTKASTGFTFKNTTKKTTQLIHFLQTQNDFRKWNPRDKFWFYDLLFLDVLYKRNDLGNTIFSSLFKKGNPELILKFLDEETSFSEDLKVMLKCPTWIFVKILFARFLKF